jgi:hypothetical protein
MIFYGPNKHLYLEEEQDPTGAAGAGGTVTDPKPPADPEPADESFSKKQVDQREAKLRRRYDREIRELKQEMEALKTQAKTQEPPLDPQHDPNPEPGDLAGRIELMEKRFTRREAELQEKIDQSRSLYEDERQKRLSVEKDRLLQDALTAAGVAEKNRLAAERYFRPQIIWDKVDEVWAFETKQKNVVPILDGVAEEMPDIFKPSKLAHGGAGTGQGAPAARNQLARELDAAEKELGALKDKAMRNQARGEFMRAFTLKKAEVEALRKRLNKK